MVDSDHIVRLRGLPWSASASDVIKFLDGRYLSPFYHNVDVCFMIRECIYACLYHRLAHGNADILNNGSEQLCLLSKVEFSIYKKLCIAF